MHSVRIPTCLYLQQAGHKAQPFAAEVQIVGCHPPLCCSEVVDTSWQPSAFTTGAARVMLSSLGVVATFLTYKGFPCA